MARQFDKKLVLEDGSVFYGYGFGADVERVCELVFNTMMVGYQEIISDPAYTNQAVVMTYPLIGNYGMTNEDNETKSPSLGALIVREYNDSPSNFRFAETLSESLEENKIPGIYGFDTRELTRKIRNEGNLKGMICGIEKNTEEIVELIKNTELEKNLVPLVSCKKRWYSRTSNPKHSVVAIDLGMKLSVVNMLNKLGCNVTILPWNATKEEIDSINPDGVVITSGPGNPEEVCGVVELIKAVKGKYPLFGIGLGENLIAMAYGAKIVKLIHGHRGGYAVRDLKNGKVTMTSQNHGYAVDMESIEGTEIEITQVNINDGSIEAIEVSNDRVMAVGYLPESNPGPQDSGYVFDEFLAMMEEVK